jgi:antitoxin VapB
METAKVFWTDDPHVIQLPKEFQLDAEQVQIRRQGNTIVIEPLTQDWDWLDEVIGPLDDDFEQAVNEQSAHQDRPELDYFK